jgi:hemolysin activation/secretion protein
MFLLRTVAMEASRPSVFFWVMKYLQQATSALVLLLLATCALGAEVADDTFDINEFRVLGTQALERTKVEAAVYPFLGPKKTLKTVEQARDALKAAYREAGYGAANVYIPEQSVDEGIVRLQVTEGRIDKVRVSGARYYSERKLLAEMSSLKPELPALQSGLSRLANEARDREITPILKAGRDPGTVAVDLNVKDHVPLHASLEMNNRYTSDTTHTRLNATLSYDNLWQRDESLSFQYQTAPAAPSEVKLYALTYSGRTPSPDWTWAAYAIRSNSDVAAVGALDVIGNGKIFGGRLIRAFDSGPGRVNSFTFGVDYKNFGQDIRLPSDVSAATPIHYAIWSGQLAMTRLHEHFDFSNSIALNFGVRGIVGDDDEFEFKRYGASAGFAYLRGSSDLTWRVWRGFVFDGRLNYQYSEAPLVSNEQFSLGGVDSVRGYLEAEELDDSGIAAQVELRFPRLTLGPSQTVLYLFYDKAVGMNQMPLPSEIESATVRSDLSSVGIGLHAMLFHGFNANFEWARPRLDGTRTLRGESRVHFSVLYGF